jgi:hypothetical protein
MRRCRWRPWLLRARGAGAFPVFLRELTA